MKVKSKNETKNSEGRWKVKPKLKNGEGEKWKRNWKQKTAKEGEKWKRNWKQWIEGRWKANETEKSEGEKVKIRAKVKAEVKRVNKKVKGDGERER